jgi:hypothetical protein
MVLSTWPGHLPTCAANRHLRLEGAVQGTLSSLSADIFPLPVSPSQRSRALLSLRSTARHLPLLPHAAASRLQSPTGLSIARHHLQPWAETPSPRGPRRRPRSQPAPPPLSAMGGPSTILTTSHRSALPPTSRASPSHRGARPPLQAH